MTTALLDRLTHHCHVVETGNESYRFALSLMAIKFATMKEKPAVCVVLQRAGCPDCCGVLYQVTGWLWVPMIAALTMSFSSVTVIGNALRLRAV